MAALRTTEPLRRELAATLPDRPFTITFWDGTELPESAGQVTTAQAMGDSLLARLQRAGISFRVLESSGSPVAAAV